MATKKKFNDYFANSNSSKDQYTADELKYNDYTNSNMATGDSNQLTMQELKFFQDNDVAKVWDKNWLDTLNEQINHANAMNKIPPYSWDDNPFSFKSITDNIPKPMQPTIGPMYPSTPAPSLTPPPMTTPTVTPSPSFINPDYNIKQPVPSWEMGNMVQDQMQRDSMTDNFGNRVGEKAYRYISGIPDNMTMEQYSQVPSMEKSNMQNLQGHSAYSPSNFNSPSSIGPATGMVKANMDQRFILDTAKQFMYGLAGAAGGDALGSVYDKVMFENNKATGYQYPSGYSQRTDAMQSGLSQEEIDAAAQRDDQLDYSRWTGNGVNWKPEQTNIPFIGEVDLPRAVGAITGEVAKMISIGGAAGLATKGISNPILQKIVERTLMGMGFGGVTALEKNLDTGETLKEMGRSALFMNVGGGASDLTRGLLGKALNNSTFRNTVTGEIAKAVTGGVAFGVAGTAATYPTYPEGQKPGMKELVTNAITGALFEAIPGVFRTIKNVKSSKVAFKEDFTDYGRRVSKAYDVITANPDPVMKAEQYRKLSAELDKGINDLAVSSKYLGQNKKIGEAITLLKAGRTNITAEAEYLENFNRPQITPSSIKPEPFKTGDAYIPGQPTKGKQAPMDARTSGQFPEGYKGTGDAYIPSKGITPGKPLPADMRQPGEFPNVANEKTPTLHDNKSKRSREEHFRWMIENPNEYLPEVIEEAKRELDKILTKKRENLNKAIKDGKTIPKDILEKHLEAEFMRLKKEVEYEDEHGKGYEKGDKLTQELLKVISQQEYLKRNGDLKDFEEYYQDQSGGPSLDETTKKEASDHLKNLVEYFKNKKQLAELEEQVKTAKGKAKVDLNRQISKLKARTRKVPSIDSINNTRGFKGLKTYDKSAIRRKAKNIADGISNLNDVNMDDYLGTKEIEKVYSDDEIKYVIDQMTEKDKQKRLKKIDEMVASGHLIENATQLVDNMNTTLYKENSHEIKEGLSYELKKGGIATVESIENEKNKSGWIVKYSSDNKTYHKKLEDFINETRMNPVDKPTDQPEFKVGDSYTLTNKNGTSIAKITGIRTNKDGKTYIEYTNIRNGKEYTGYLSSIDRFRTIATKETKPEETKPKDDTIDVGGVENVDMDKNSRGNDEGSPTETTQEIKDDRETKPLPKEPGEKSGGDLQPNDNGSEKEPSTRPVKDGPNEERVSDSGNSEGVRNERVNNVSNNYRIKSDDILAEGGKKTKFKNNIAAIKLVKQLVEEGRRATPEEQKVLIKYVGWGGIKEAFDYEWDNLAKTYVPKHSDWEKQYDELITLLEPEEYTSARKSIRNAHYTRPEVISAMYDIARQLGFKGGKILEPASGIGHFIGVLPDDMLSKSQFMAVEKDNITGLIAKNLYPDSNVKINGFEKVAIPDNYFDMAISNVPFGDIPITDPTYKDLHYAVDRIHNYFFIKSLDKVKEGGLVVFVTSTGTMDTSSKAFRQHIKDRADLVAAYRLPNDMFKENAGTEVTTDIIILRKRAKGEVSKTENFMQNKDTETKLRNGNFGPVNEYFINNPDNVLGKFVEDKLTGNRLGVVSNGDTFAKLKSRIEQLPKDIYSVENTSKVEDLTNEDQANDMRGTKEGSYITKGNKVYQVKDGKPVEVGGQTETKDTTKMTLDEKTKYERSQKSKATLQRNRLIKVKDLVEIRDSVKELLAKQMETAGNVNLSGLQKQLNTLYDKFVKKHGYINLKKNRILMKDDPEVYLLYALEIEKNLTGSEDSDTSTFVKADVFTKRVITPYIRATTAKNAKEALAVVLYEDGFVNIDRIASLTGKSNDEVISSLGDDIFSNPNGTWETSSEYLSGNVKDKLQNAIDAAAIDVKYEKNVAALKAAQPNVVPFEKIKVKLGAGWIPTDDISTFLNGLLNTNYTEVSYNKFNGKWKVEVESTYGNVEVQNLRAGNLSASDLVTKTLNNDKIQVTYKDENGATHVDVDATNKAKTKSKQLQDKFYNYLNNNIKLQEKLEGIYNDKFNVLVERKYSNDGKTYIGMSNIIGLRSHQVQAIERIIYGGNTLLAHDVGFGKTFIMLTAAMELKRLGIAKKPLIIMPNMKLTDFKNDMIKLYPQAKILAAETDDFKPINIKSLFAKIATNDWDVIFIRHSSFEKIPVSDQLMREHIERELAELRLVLTIAKQTGEKKFTTAQIETRIEKLEDELASLNKRPKYDVINFEQMGIDYLFVDESHTYKNLAFPTTKSDIKGVNSAGGPVTRDFYIKSKYITSLHGGKKGLVFATGTPVTNALNELFTTFKYLRPDLLENTDTTSFDAWLSVFGSVESKPEVGTGGVFKFIERFRGFHNLKQLFQMFKEYADMRYNSKEAGIKLPELKNGKPTIVESEPHPEYENYIKNVILTRIKNMPKGRAAREKGADNALAIGNSARQATVDIRLAIPGAKDFDNSKLNKAVNNIIKDYKASNDYKGTQLVFFDRSKSPIFDSSLDIAKKLIKAGIPEKEIAFANKYDTEIKLQDLFLKLNSGEIRILIGTYAKMSTGLNVQERLYSLHEIDTPWRPADILQAEGRMIRQGNKHSEWSKPVNIYRYVVSGTTSYDAVMWQTIEAKIKAINNLMSGDVDEITAEEDAADSAEKEIMIIKAKALGDGRIIRQIELQEQLPILEAERSAYYNEINTYRRVLKNAPEEIANSKARLDKLNKDKEQFEKYDLKEVNVVVNKKTFEQKAGQKFEKDEKTPKKLAGAAIKKALEKAYFKQDETVIATFKGITLYTKFENGTIKYKGEYNYGLGGYYDIQISDLNSDEGIIDRINNKIEGRIRHSIDSDEKNITTQTKNIEVAKEKVTEDPFPKEKLYEELKAEKDMLDFELENNVSLAETKTKFTAKKSVNNNTVDGFTSARGGPSIGKATGKNTKGKAMRASEIYKKFGDKLKVAINKTKVGRGTLGNFNPNTYIIRIKKANDIPVLAHETGHLLDTLYVLSKDAFNGELEALGQATSRPSYKKDRIRREGVAEFVRLYLTDNDAALKQAPLFNTFFQTIVPADVLATINELKDDIYDLTNLDPVERIGKSIQFRGDKKAKEPLDIMRKLRQLYTGAFYDQYPIEWAAKQAGGKNTQESIRDRLATLRGYEGIALFNLNPERSKDYYQTDITGHKVGKSYSEITDKIHKNEKIRRLFWKYSVARRAKDYFDRGLEMPDSLETNEAAVKILDAKYPEFKKVFNDLLQYRHNTANLLVEGGIYSKQKLDDIEANNPNYVSLKRIMEAVDGVSGSGRKLAAAKKLMKRRTGGGEDIMDPEESDINNTFLYRNAAMRNKALLEFVDMFDHQVNPSAPKGLGWIVERAPVKINATMFNMEQLKKVLKDMGIDTAGIDLDIMARIFNPNYLAGPNQIVVYRKGDPVIYNVHPDVYQAISALKYESMNAITQILAAIANVQRAGIIYTPKYIAFNFSRDFFHSLISSKTGINPLHIFNGLISSIFKGGFYKLAQKSGGTTNNFSANDRKFANEAIDDIMSGQTMAKRFVKGIRHPFRTMQDLISPFENAARIAELKKYLKKNGYSETDINKAVYYMRDLSIDFKRIGAWVKLLQLNRISLFFNTQLQGVDKTVRMFNNPKTALKTILKGLIYITIPTLILLYINRENPNYKKLPAWRKDFFWNIPLGDPKSTNIFIPIPRPWELGLIFGALPERIVSQYVDNNPEAWTEFDKSMRQSFMPELTVSAFQPEIEVALNKDFRDYPILSKQDQELEPKLQYNDYTSEIAKGAGNITNQSPKQLQHLITGHFGTLGKMFLDGSDATLGKKEGNMVTPLFRGFTVDSKQYNPDTDMFYKNRDIVKKRIEGGKKLGETKNEKDSELMSLMNNATDKFSELRKIKTYYVSKGTQADIEKATTTIENVSKDVNKIYDTIYDKNIDIETAKKKTLDAKRSILNTMLPFYKDPEIKKMLKPEPTITSAKPVSKFEKTGVSKTPYKK